MVHSLLEWRTECSKSAFFLFYRNPLSQIEWKIGQNNTTEQSSNHQSFWGPTYSRFHTHVLDVTCFHVTLVTCVYAASNPIATLPLVCYSSSLQPVSLHVSLLSKQQQQKKKSTYCSHEAIVYAVEKFKTIIWMLSGKNIWLFSIFKLFLCYFI